MFCPTCHIDYPLTREYFYAGTGGREFRSECKKCWGKRCVAWKKKARAEYVVSDKDTTCECGNPSANSGPYARIRNSYACRSCLEKDGLMTEAWDVSSALRVLGGSGSTSAIHEQMRKPGDSYASLSRRVLRGVAELRSRGRIRTLQVSCGTMAEQIYSLVDRVRFETEESLRTNTWSTRRTRLPPLRIPYWHHCTLCPTKVIANDRDGHLSRHGIHGTTNGRLGAVDYFRRKPAPERRLSTFSNGGVR